MTSKTDITPAILSHLWFCRASLTHIALYSKNESRNCDATWRHVWCPATLGDTRLVAGSATLSQLWHRSKEGWFFST